MYTYIFECAIVVLVTEYKGNLQRALLHIQIANANTKHF